MNGLIQLAIEPANLPYSILLGFILIYWASVFIGVLDLDFFDLDLDGDTELEMDLDADIDAEVDADVSGPGGIAGAMAFLNLGKVPFMIFLSFLFISLWAMALIGHHLLKEYVTSVFIIWLVPNIILSLLLTKVFTTPLKGIYAKLNQEGVRKKQLVGKLGEVLIAVSPGKIGRIDLTSEENHFVLDVKTHEITIPKGQKAIIVEYDEEEDIYYVSPFEI